MAQDSKQKPSDPHKGFKQKLQAVIDGYKIARQNASSRRASDIAQLELAIRHTNPVDGYNSVKHVYDTMVPGGFWIFEFNRLRRGLKTFLTEYPREAFLEQVAIFNYNSFVDLTKENQSQLDEIRDLKNQLQWEWQHDEEGAKRAGQQLRLEMERVAMPRIVEDGKGVASTSVSPPAHTPKLINLSFLKERKRSSSTSSASSISSNDNAFYRNASSVSPILTSVPPLAKK
jgi:hypothetical protein